MEDSPKIESDLAELVSSLNERLTALEVKVTKISSTQEQGRNERPVYKLIVVTAFSVLFG